MSLIIGLALSLALGVVADLTAAVVRAPSRWSRPVLRFVSDARALWRDRDRASASEALGAGAAMLGASIAAGAALGGVPGSAVLLYLALVLACTGGHLATATAPTSAGVERASRARLATLAAEPAFAVALGAVFLRWRTADLDAIRGAHDVLGQGYLVGDGAAVGGVTVAVVALAIAGALRLPPEPGEEAGAAGGLAVAGTLARWVVAGASALVTGALLAARTAPGSVTVEDLPLLAIAAAAALLLGTIRGIVIRLRARVDLWVAGAATVLAAAAALLVSVG